MVTGNGGVLVIGPGALGAYTAARLAAAGRDVTVACRTPETAAAIARDGVAAIEPDGRRTTAQVAAVHGPGDLEAHPGLVILATKCAAAVPAWRAWRRVVPDGAPLVTFQNGLMGDHLAPEAAGRLVVCTVAFPATLIGTGQSERTGPGGFLLGAWPPRERPDATEEKAQGVLADAAAARVVPDILGVQWTKLTVNSCITTLGVVTGRPLGELLQDPRARDVFLDIATEAFRVGTEARVDFATIHGFHPRRFADRRPGQSRRLRHMLLRVVGRKYRRHRSSSLQSLERGDRTEVDFLNGAIVATADAHGVAAPVNRAVVDLVHAVEAGDVEPSPDLLDRLRTTARA